VLRVELDATAWADVDGDETQPFIRYRRRLFSYQLARNGGMSDQQFCDLVRELDEAVARTDGHGFVVTPLKQEERLSSVLGLGASGLWVKDETGNVSGSHKGRHLFGVMLYLRVAEWRRGGGPGAVSQRLAVASCGNAALAAAVVARAAGRSLDVFIPPSADPFVVSRLRSLGAQMTVCERRPSEAGDPCYLRFREALTLGAVPFCCQGPDNGLTIDGGKTLAYELLDSLGGTGMDRVFLQVGGGAFASAFVQACREAVSAGALERLPRIHAVQTRGAFPLKRAWERFVELAVRATGADAPGSGTTESERARWLHVHAGNAVVRSVLASAARHRHEFMRPWESEPHSIAHGILDDETYDWLEIVGGMVESGGWPVVVSEEELRRANGLARSETALDVDHTGSSGLAGLVHLLDTDTAAASALRDEHIAVVFTGAQRHA
jgi:threonine dehydratase